MENRGSTEGDGDEKTPPGGAAARTSDLTEANIKGEDYFAQEFSSDLLSMAMSSTLSGSPPFAASQSTSPASKINDNDGRSVAHGGVSGTKKLEHAPPGEPLPPPRFLRPMDYSESPPVARARHQDVTHGAFVVQPSRNAVTSSILRAPNSWYTATTQVMSEESKQDDGAPNSAGGYNGSHDGSGTAAECGLYTVEARRVRDGWYQRPVYRWIFWGSILFACVAFTAVVVVVVLVLRPQSAASGSSLTPPTTVVTTSLPNTTHPTSAPATSEPITATPIFAPISSPIPGTPLTRAPTTAAPTAPDPTAAPPTPEPITATPISAPITVVLPTRAPTTAAPTTPEPTAAPPTPDPFTAPPTRVPTTAPPTSKPTFLTPELIACNFLSMRYENLCRSALEFQDTTMGSTIPSEIGLLTQLTYLNINFNLLTSTIPSEIGLLTQLTRLDFGANSLTSSIPSEIGLLTQLTALVFSYNLLTSTIPSEIGLLTQLTWLDFSNNVLKGTVPSSLCPITPRDGFSFVIVDCFEITCVSGCCWDRYEDGSLCS